MDVGFRNFELRSSVYWYKVFTFFAAFIFRAVLNHNVQAFNCDGVETFEVFQTGGDFFSPEGSIWTCSDCMYMLVFCTFLGHVCQPLSVYTFIVQILRQYTALQKNSFPLGDVTNLLEGHSMVTEVHRLITDEVCF